MNEIVNFTERIVDGITPMEAHEQPHAEPGSCLRADGFSFAGVHILIDLWGARHLDDAAAIESAFMRAVLRAGATLLHTNFHTFTPYGGVSGVAVLAESHISIHTWPEHGFAAADVFMCGAPTDLSRSLFLPARQSQAQRLVGGQEPGLALPQ